MSESESDVLFSVDTLTKDDLANDNFVDVAGWYHFQVTEVIPELSGIGQDGKDRTPVVKMKCVVRHTIEGQSPAGKMLFHDLYVGAKGGGPPPEGSKKNVTKFLLGLGLMEFRDIDGKPLPVNSETGSPEISLTLLKKCNGKHFIAKVDQEKDQTNIHGQTFKGKFKIPFSTVYLPGSPAVEKVAYNKALIDAEVSNGGFSGGKASGGPPVVPDDEGF